MGEDIFIKKIRDIYRLAEKYQSPCFSHFLDEAQIAELMRDGIFGGVLFGGYDGAERQMLGVFPDWQEPQNELFPIAVISITKKYTKELTHRHYLGTVLSLGIAREKIGDILVHDEGAYIFCEADIAEYIRDNITKIASCGVNAEAMDIHSVKLPERRFTEINAVAASARLDAVLAALLNVSRSEAKAQLLSGKVSVNHIPMQNPSAILNEGDLLSVRGFGRAELVRFGAKTRSERVHVVLKKFI